MAWASLCLALKLQTTLRAKIAVLIAQSISSNVEKNSSLKWEALHKIFLILVSYLCVPGMRSECFRFVILLYWYAVVRFASLICSAGLMQHVPSQRSAASSQLGSAALQTYKHNSINPSFLLLLQTKSKRYHCIFCRFETSMMMLQSGEEIHAKANPTGCSAFLCTGSGFYLALPSGE